MWSLSKNFAIFGIAILLSAGVFCVVGATAMDHQNMSSDMSALCASENNAPILCAFTGSNHASLMEVISHAVPQKIGEYLLIFALAILLFAFGKQFAPHLQKFKEEPHYLYIKSPEIFSIINPLRLAFARGIIHPKIYNSARIL